MVQSEGQSNQSHQCHGQILAVFSEIVNIKPVGVGYYYFLLLLVLNV